MEIDEIRRHNINYWCDKLGRDTVAAKAGYEDTNYINQLCRGHGSFGKNTARRLEDGLGLVRGWFDELHDETFPVNLNRQSIGLDDHERQIVANLIRDLKARRGGASGT